MLTADQARGEIVAAINILIKRRATTTDDAEKDAINDEIKTLNGQIQDLNQADLLAAATTVAQAADALERVIGAAKVGPFGGYLAALEAAIDRLQGVQGQMHATEALPTADTDAPAGPVAAPVGAPAGTVVLTSTAYAELSAEYEQFFDACTVRPEAAGNIQYYLSRLAKNKPQYAGAGAELGVPWQFIGILHAMEAGFNFSTHLHNGDPLTARTVHVPAGRPQVGTPPFSWQESARDALMLKRLHQETDWSVPRQLYLFERYNGFGYRRMGRPTPYLWSFSNLYEKGKFVSDGHYDSEAVSKQCGAAVMLKALQAAGML